MPVSKPWTAVPIRECGEAMQSIPNPAFAFVSPHPYQQLGAPYRGASPHQLRTGVLQRLQQAQSLLQAEKPGWRFLIFDAYRPNAVQQFMVDDCFRTMAAALSDSPTATPDELIWEQVYQFWAVPSADPATPPAHSTGAAIDLSLCDEHGEQIDMGTPIDEFTTKAFPEHFADSVDAHDQQVHRNRVCLRELMQDAGFAQHPNEWWHFSFGDQLWAWTRQQQNHPTPYALYGRAELT